MRRLMSWISIVAIVLVVGCAAYPVEGPGIYNHEGVMVTPQLLEVKGSKLRLRFTFANHSDKEIVVDRSQMSLILPDGQVMAVIGPP